MFKGLPIELQDEILDFVRAPRLLEGFAAIENWRQQMSYGPRDTQITTEILSGRNVFAETQTCDWQLEIRFVLSGDDRTLSRLILFFSSAEPCMNQVNPCDGSEVTMVHEVTLYEVDLTTFDLLEHCPRGIKAVPKDARMVFIPWQNRPNYRGYEHSPGDLGRLYEARRIEYFLQGQWRHVLLSG